MAVTATTARGVARKARRRIAPTRHALAVTADTAPSLEDVTCNGRCLPLPRSGRTNSAAPRHV